MKCSLFSIHRICSTGTVLLAALFWLLYLSAGYVTAQSKVPLPAESGQTTNDSATLRIAVAANFAPTLRKLLDAFASSTPAGGQSVISIASTGTLFHQIVHGAPFDLYFAANEAHPRELLARGLGAQDSLLNYAQGQLLLLHKQKTRHANNGMALATQMNACKPNANAEDNATALSALLSSAQQVIIANPLTAPYGSVSKLLIEKLQNQDRSPRDSVLHEGSAARKLPELLIARNVMHAQQLFASSAADAAFISLPQYLANPQTAREPRWLACHVNPTLHAPILQFAIALTNANRERDTLGQAKALLTFASSIAGRHIIARDGYIPTPAAQHNAASHGANNAASAVANDVANHVVIHVVNHVE